MHAYMIICVEPAKQHEPRILILCGCATIYIYIYYDRMSSIYLDYVWKMDTVTSR